MIADVIVVMHVGATKGDHAEIIKTKSENLREFFFRIDALTFFFFLTTFSSPVTSGTHPFEMVWKHVVKTESCSTVQLLTKLAGMNKVEFLAVGAYGRKGEDM